MLNSTSGNAALEAIGWDAQKISEATVEQLREMYEQIGNLRDDNIADTTEQVQEMLASTASNYAELLQMGEEISAEAMSKQMQAFASEAAQNATSLVELQNALQ